MFNSWSLKGKLIGAFSICALILAGVGGIAYVRLHDVINGYQHIVDNNMPNYMALSDVLDATRRYQIVINRLLGSQLSADELRGITDDFDKAKKDVTDAVKRYLDIPFVPGEDALWKKVSDNLDKVTSHMELTVRTAQGTDEESQAKRDEYATGYEQIRKPYREAMDDLRSFQSKETTKWAELASSTGQTASNLVLTFVGAGVIAALLLGFFISASLASTMSRVAGQLSSGADEVTSAATEISSTSEQLSASATEQASSLQETASSIEEMSSMVKQNSDNATRSSEIAKTGQNTASKGKQVVDEMISAINDIDSANREISEVLKVIGQIGSKTKIIDDIVFKTQLLSFNASVEAARAGEHGKGFAVVAEEVGNLAQMSGNAAREISEMLDQSMERVERMISTAKQKVEVGTNISKRCGEVLDELVGNVSEVNGMANEIATACQEQARGINEITRAMTQLDQVTQQNASASQQSATAAEQLSHQAETLRSSVGELLHLLNGSNSNVNIYNVPPASHRRANVSAPKHVTKLDQARKKKQNQELRGVEAAPSGKHEGFEEVA